VYWPEEKQWFTGYLKAIQQGHDDGKDVGDYYVVYDDGEEHWEPLGTRTQYKWVKKYRKKDLLRQHAQQAEEARAAKEKAVEAERKALEAERMAKKIEEAGRVAKSQAKAEYERGEENKMDEVGNLCIACAQPVHSLCIAHA